MMGPSPRILSSPAWGHDMGRSIRVHNRACWLNSLISPHLGPAAVRGARAQWHDSSALRRRHCPDRPAYSRRRAALRVVTLARRPWDPRLGPLQVATLRRALEREGMVTAWWSDLPGARMAEHAHAFPETRWVVEGFLRVTAGAEAVDLGPGDRLDLPPNLPHTIEVLG